MQPGQTFTYTPYGIQPFGCLAVTLVCLVFSSLVLIARRILRIVVYFVRVVSAARQMTLQRTRLDKRAVAIVGPSPEETKKKVVSFGGY